MPVSLTPVVPGTISLQPGDPAYGEGYYGRGVYGGISSLTLTPISQVSGGTFCSESLACSASLVCSDHGVLLAPLVAV